MLRYYLDIYKAQKMCDKTVDACLSALRVKCLNRPLILTMMIMIFKLWFMLDLQLGEMNINNPKHLKGS